MSEFKEEGIQSQALVAPVREVMVMEDRARVRRQGRISLAKGRHRLAISDVAPVLVDKTLLVSLSIEDPEQEISVTLSDSRVFRETISPVSSRDSGESHLELVAQRNKLLRDIAVAGHKLKECHNQSTALNTTRRLCVAEIAEDSAYGKNVAPEWKEKLAGLATQCMESLDTYAVLVDERETLQERRKHLDMRINETTTPADRRSARIEIDVDCPDDCDLQLQIDYSVPGACWRPYHQARLSNSAEGSVVEVKTDACVWQNTGEDWTNIDLLLSTERASLGVEPPVLDSDTLYLRRKSSSVQVEARDQRIDTTGLGTSSKTEVPGIDDGGSVQQMRAPQKCSLPSDGRPHRIFLQSFEAQATSAWTATPELSPCVILTTTLENVGEVPLLAGPVDLIRESGLIGRSKLLYVASGSQFDIGWGPESDIRLRRQTEVSSESSRLLSSWNEKVHTTRVLVSNLGDQEFSLLMQERVPVSEIDKVKIEVNTKTTTNNSAPNEDGIVEWTVLLPAQGQEKVELQYSVKVHDDVEES